MSYQYVLPGEIEKRSFEILTKELGDRKLLPENEPVIKRVIHTTADFDYVDNLVFSDGAVTKAVEAFKAGAGIVKDTQMALSGIHKSTLESFGGTARCFMSDPEVARLAKERQTTRAWVSMEEAARLPGRWVFAIGNAPTALIRLHELILEKKVDPVLVIGVPVGFVNVVESKEEILKDPVPYIVARGRKGGSNVAAAICNALLYRRRKDAIGRYGLYLAAVGIPAAKAASVKKGIGTAHAWALLPTGAKPVALAFHKPELP